jgi:hypothetical protein
MANEAEMRNGLCKNGRDSITHALDHFRERGLSDTNRRHHDKWIVLSVHHAAECVCNLRLLQLEPECPLFARSGGLWFPSLSEALKRLQNPPNAAQLSPAERQLLRLLGKLPDIRHQFMHRLAPEKLDVSIAAMCMIGLLKYIERLTGETASDIVWQSSPVESDVVAAIRSNRSTDYDKFVELFLREKYASHQLLDCPSCGVFAVDSYAVSPVCEACFEELDYVTCPETDEKVYFVAWQRTQGDIKVECQHCGGTHALT